MFLIATLLLPIHYSVLMFTYLKNILVLRIHIHMLRINILTLRIQFSRSFQSNFKVICENIILTMANHRTIFTDLMVSNILIMNFSQFVYVITEKCTKDIF